MNNNISLVIPTYKEKDNIQPLVTRLSEALADYKYEIVIMDDNSRDGTEELVKSLSEQFPVKIVVRRDKKGLASAVVDGFGYAETDIIVVMDADLQHPPEVVPSLVKAINEGADIAIGSRYIEGGGCEGWSALRRIMSKGAALISHLFLPSTRKIKDPMSGFFVIKREVVKEANLNPSGFKILLEILMLGNWKSVVEVPFMFVTRSRGESKLNTKQQLDYLKHIYSLMQRTGELVRFIKFCIVGGSGVIVNLGLYTLLTRYGSFTPIDDTSAGLLSGNIALTISIETSIITNFILNNFFTFSDRNSGGIVSFFKRLLNFNLICVVGALIQIGITNLFAVVFGFYDIVSVLIGIVIAFLWNYLLNNVLTWKK
ncbi:MAG TPA: dolichol monophosphate mannose synthase [Dehalococcoidia bacterium]|nr:dolichol monophosphate mannose synthase [Dehalococcoidia bacterium]